jgi:hypothetical protein
MNFCVGLSVSDDAISKNLGVLSSLQYSERSASAEHACALPLCRHYPRFTLSYLFQP